jgi:hypothetical protein
MKAQLMLRASGLLLLLLAAGFCAPFALAESPAAAFVTAIDLQGADSEAGTAVRRGQELIRPRLLMPLYEGDVVFLRDAASSIVLETDAGAEETVSGAGARFVVKQNNAAKGSLWDMLGAVADAVSGEDGDVAPDNMMTRDTDDVLTVPMAVRGANRVLADRRPVWIAWQGGKAPYKVRITTNDGTAVHEGIATKEFSFSLPTPSQQRLKITVEDAGGRRTSIIIRSSDKRPQPKFGVSDLKKTGAVVRLAAAAWLTSIDDGSWSLEAARMLREDGGADSRTTLLLAKIAAGWKAQVEH